MNIEQGTRVEESRNNEKKKLYDFSITAWWLASRIRLVFFALKDSKAHAQFEGSLEP